MEKRKMQFSHSISVKSGKKALSIVVGAIVFNKNVKPLSFIESAILVKIISYNMIWKL